MITVQKDTKDIKLGWLAFLYNAVFSLSRLRNDYLTISNCTMDRYSKSDIASISTAEEVIEELESRLMDSWGIERNTLLKWMDSGPGDYAKRMNLKISTDLHSRSLPRGRTKRSRRK